MATGHARHRVVEHDEGVDRRQAERVVRREARRPTSCPPGRRPVPSPRRCAGIAWANEPAGRGCTRSSAELARRPAGQRGHVVGEPEPLVERRHRREHVGRRSQRSGGRDRRTVGGRTAGIVGSGVAMAATPHPDRYDFARWPRSTSRRASRTSSSSATRSPCTTRSPAIEKDPRRAEAFRTIAGNERRHAEVWANKLRELGAPSPSRDGPRTAGPHDHAHRAPVRDPRRAGPGPGARGRRGGRVHRPELARGRGDRRRRARARRDLAAAQRAAAGPGHRGSARAAGHRGARALAPGRAGRGRCGRSSSASPTASSRISRS